MTSSVRSPNPEVADLRGVVLDGRYQIGQPLSAGGMGTVYTGDQLALRREVAIKLVKPGVMNRDVQVRRLVREAQTTAMVKHPNVIEIIDVGVMQHGFVYLVMELLEGTDLRALLRRERKLDWPRARNIAMQVVSALKAAHSQGVIHRDVKPSNVFMVGQAGGVTGDFVKVLDFGLAKCRAEGRSATLTGADEVVGTAAYLAPEVARGKKADFRSEVYSVGVLMYKMVTGTVPFKGSNPLDVLAKAISNPVPPPRSHDATIPAEADKIIRRCLAKRPELRPQTMEELERDLYRIGGSDFVQGFEAPIAGGPTGEQTDSLSMGDMSEVHASAPVPKEDPSDVLEAALSEVLELEVDELTEVDPEATGFLRAQQVEENRGRAALRLVPDPDPTPPPGQTAVQKAPPAPRPEASVSVPGLAGQAPQGTRVARRPVAPGTASGGDGFAEALRVDTRGFAPALQADAGLSPLLAPEAEAPEAAPRSSKKGLWLGVAATVLLATAAAGVLLFTGVVPGIAGRDHGTPALAMQGVVGEAWPDVQPGVKAADVAPAAPVPQPVAEAPTVPEQIAPAVPAVPVPEPVPAGSDPAADAAGTVDTAAAAEEPTPPETPVAATADATPEPAPKKKPAAKKRRRRPTKRATTPAAAPRPTPAPPAPAPRKKKRPAPKDNSAPWKRVPVPSDNW